MFTIKLQDTVLPNGKIIRGEEVSFETGVELSDWYEAQMAVRHPRKKKKRRRNKDVRHKSDET